MGLERLATYLLDRGDVTPEQMEEARRTQGFFGGQIASHLLELGFLDEATLGRALSEVTGLPYAGREQMSSIDAGTVDLLDAAAVRRLKVCPFERAGKRLRLAMVNPRDAVAIHEVGRVTGYEVEPWVTCESRLHQALERHYRIRTERSRRVIPSLARRTDTPEPADLSEPPAAGSAGSPVELGLDGRPLDAEITYEEHLEAGRRRPPFDPPDDIESGLGRSTDPATDADPLAVLDAALVDARDRDSVASAVLEFCAGRARRGALFALTREGLRCLGARGRGFDGGRLGELVFPVEPSTVFDAALRSRDFFFGVVPPLPANRDLYTALGGRLPAMAMVLPLAVKGRVAALLYIDDDDRPMSHPDIPLMRRVAAKAGLAFEILLLRSKLLDI